MSVFKDEVKGTWTAKFRYTDWKGIRKQKKKENFKTQREAKAFEADFLLKQSGSPDITFEGLSVHYLEDCKVRLKPTTYDGKMYLFKSKLDPYFGKVPLKDITAVMIRKWQTELISQGYTQTYLKTVNNQLSAALNYAVRFYGLKENPCHKAGSMGKKRADGIEFWTIDEFNQFIQYSVDNPVAHVMFNLLFYTGVRSGEALALTLNDFDFEKRTMYINKNYAKLKGEDLIMTPKTPKSIRTITLPVFLCDMIKTYSDRLYDYKPSERLFMLNKFALHNEMKRGIKRSNLKHIRLHDLRHSHASLLIEMGFSPLLISERLGHENIETTLQTYSHLYPNKHSEVADKLEEINLKYTHS